MRQTLPVEMPREMRDGAGDASRQPKHRHAPPHPAPSTTCHPWGTVVPGKMLSGGRHGDSRIQQGDPPSARSLGWASSLPGAVRLRRPKAQPPLAGDVLCDLRQTAHLSELYCFMAKQKRTLPGRSPRGSAHFQDTGGRGALGAQAWAPRPPDALPRSRRGQGGLGEELLAVGQ